MKKWQISKPKSSTGTSISVEPYTTLKNASKSVFKTKGDLKENF